MWTSSLSIRCISAAVPPQARAVLQFEGTPIRWIDLAAAPTALDHERGRRLGVKRRHKVVGVTSERNADAILLAQRDIVGLTDIVEREQFDYQMMHAVATGFDQGEAVMPRIDVKEVGAKRLLHVIAETEPEQVDIERHHRVDVFHRQHRVPEPERTGAETGDRTAGFERHIVGLRTVKRCEAIAAGIAERNQGANPSCVGQRLRFGCHLDLGLFKPGRERLQRRRIGNFPAEKACSIRKGAVDDDALLAIVHPECEQRGAALHRLQTNEAGAKLPPVLERSRAETGISQSLHRHGLLPVSRGLSYAYLGLSILDSVSRHYPTS